MRVRSQLSSLVAVVALLGSGSIGAQQASTETHPDPVPVFEMIHPYAVSTYDVVGRLWAGSWRTAFRLPTYAKKEDAIAAMQAEAAKLNADALINMSCVDQQGSTWFAKNEPDYICYAVAIQTRKNKS
jgi:uncharacterized protein YbjQ (UPF0145 family)